MLLERRQGCLRFRGRRRVTEPILLCGRSRRSQKSPRFGLGCRLGDGADAGVCLAPRGEPGGGRPGSSRTGTRVAACTRTKPRPWPSRRPFGAGAGRRADWVLGARYAVWTALPQSCCLRPASRRRPASPEPVSGERPAWAPPRGLPAPRFRGPPLGTDGRARGPLGFRTPESSSESGLCPNASFPRLMTFSLCSRCHLD